jgi:hypothetical protein
LCDVASWESRNGIERFRRQVLSTIDGAKKYAEGRAVRFEVRRKNDVTVVEKLAAAKMAN